MKKSAAVVLLVLGFTIGMTTPTQSHHSLSVFNYETETTVTGTVTSFVFRNPHCFLHVAVEGDDGAVTAWAVEMSAIPAMIRRGVRNSTFKAGDTVTVTMNPMRSGDTAGKFVSAVAADGKTYP